MRAIGATRLATVTLFSQSMSGVQLRPVVDVKPEGKPASVGANGMSDRMSDWMSDRKSNSTRSLKMQHCSDTVT